MKRPVRLPNLLFALALALGGCTAAEPEPAAPGGPSEPTETDWIEISAEWDDDYDWDDHESEGRRRWRGHRRDSKDVAIDIEIQLALMPGSPASDLLRHICWP